MARAAAKRGQRPKADTRTRRHKDSGGQSLEQTLFFSRLRTHAKWVFVFLAIAFAGGFVIFGVGGNIGGGLGDLLGRGGGSGGRTSVSKALKETERQPKSPKAWRDLAEAYELDGRVDPAIKAWVTFATLKPKNVEGLTRLAALYEGKAGRQTDRARLAAFEVQAAQGTSFAPPTTTPLGRALAEHPDPVAQAVVLTANTKYNDAIQARGETLTKLVGTWQKLAALQPSDSNTQLQLATAAQNAGDAKTAVAAYQRFLKLAPDDVNAAYAKQQLKTLQSQLAAAPQG